MSNGIPGGDLQSLNATVAQSAPGKHPLQRLYPLLTWAGTGVITLFYYGNKLNVQSGSYLEFFFKNLVLASIANTGDRWAEYLEDSGYIAVHPNFDTAAGSVLILVPLSYYKENREMEMNAINFQDLSLLLGYKITANQVAKYLPNLNDQYLLQWAQNSTLKQISPQLMTAIELGIPRFIVTLVFGIVPGTDLLKDAAIDQFYSTSITIDKKIVSFQLQPLIQQRIESSGKTDVQGYISGMMAEAFTGAICVFLADGLSAAAGSGNRFWRITYLHLAKVGAYSFTGSADYSLKYLDFSEGARFVFMIGGLSLAGSTIHRQRVGGIYGGLRTGFTFKACEYLVKYLGYIVYQYANPGVQLPSDGMDWAYQKASETGAFLLWLVYPSSSDTDDEIATDNKQEL